LWFAPLILTVKKARLLSFYNFFNINNTIMKHLFFALSTCLLVLASCKKSKTVQEPFVLQKADFANLYKPNGTTATSYTVNLMQTPISTPVAGDNQTWDFTNHAELNTNPIGGALFLTPTNAIFNTATYAVNNNSSYSLGGAVTTNNVSVTNYWELLDLGLFQNGLSQNAVAIGTVPSFGLTVNFPIQNKRLSSSLMFIFFPAKLGDVITNSNIIDNTNYTVTAAAFGLNNTPGQTRETYSNSIEIIARGNANLKGFGTKRCLIAKDITSIRNNYFLGGSPAPAALLTNLGLVDGEVNTTTTYKYFCEGIGYVGYVQVNNAGAVTKADFIKM
jgi:hypothetical protein